MYFEVKFSSYFKLQVLQYLVLWHVQYLRVHLYQYNLLNLVPSGTGTGTQILNLIYLPVLEQLPLRLCQVTEGISKHVNLDPAAKTDYGLVHSTVGQIAASYFKVPSSRSRYLGTQHITVVRTNFFRSCTTKFSSRGTKSTTSK